MNYPSLFGIGLTTEDGDERAFAVVAMDSFTATEAAKAELGFAAKVVESSILDFGSISEIPVAGKLHPADPRHPVVEVLNQPDDWAEVHLDSDGVLSLGDHVGAEAVRVRFSTEEP